MTAILGVESRGRGCWVGCDSAVLDGSGALDLQPGPKWWRTASGIWIAGAGDVSTIRKLRARLTLRPPEPGMDLDAWADVVLGEAVCVALEGVDDDETVFMVSVRGRLMTAGAQGDVHFSLRRYQAIGAEATAARCVLASISGLDDEDRVRQALLLLADHSALVCGPMHVEWIDATDPD